MRSMQNSNSSFNSDASSQKPDEESKSPLIGIISLDSFEEEKKAMVSPNSKSRGQRFPQMKSSHSDVPLDKNPDFIKEEDLFEEMSNFDKCSKRSKCSK